MRVHLLAIGQKMPRWVRDGYLDYADRLRGELQLELKEISPGKRGRNTDVSRAIEQEGARLIAAIPRRTRVVALDVGGESWSTGQLSREVEKWLASGGDVALLIGGPEGLSRACLECADTRWSLSAMTFPHLLVRIIVAEQLYRAISLLRNHPYHRAS
jgi:23S rRNA (pseudouridine1915-N3)-methyltransferase